MAPQAFLCTRLTRLKQPMSRCGAVRLSLDEEQEIRAWTLKNAPGIPRRLASCFTWHAT
jgi:hypothetical protein